MAIVWQAEHDDVRYEVRKQGKTLRLFANGVQHSEYHPERLFTSSVWDLLWLPVFFAEPKKIRRILILGLGGGSVIAPLLRFCQPDSIVAVDLDPLHIHVAKEFFGVAEAGVECHCMNATEFVEQYRGAPFDLVVEDLFAPHDTTVSRALMPTEQWCRALSALVSAEGYLVMNHGEWREYREGWAATDQAKEGWAERYRLATDDCHNAVIVTTRRSTKSATLRANLLAEPITAAALAERQLIYQIRRLA